MCFCDADYTLKCRQLVQRLLASECRVFGDTCNSATEFHKCATEFGKICRGRMGACYLELN